MDEKTAIYRLKNGDISALEFLMENYYIKAVRTAFLVLRDNNLAEDIVQNAFIRVFERANQYDASRPFNRWFFRIVLNDAILAAKRQSRTISLDQYIEPSLQSEEFDLAVNYLNDYLLANGSVQVVPEILFEKVETHQEIWQILGQLQPEQRAVVVLRYYLDFSEAEIAEHQGSPTGTVKWRLHSARKKLRSLIEPENS